MSKPKQLLFLDMDGVLNSHQSAHYFYWKTRGRKAYMMGWNELDPIACSNLDLILEKLPDCKVVISSTWRTLFPLSDWDDKMKDLCPHLIGRVIGKTPDLNTTFEYVPRGKEIKTFLESNEWTDVPFVVLDDDCEMEDVKDRFIRIDGKVGLTYINVEFILAKMGFKGRI